MAYKFQQGAATLSGSLLQEGGIQIWDKDDQWLEIMGTEDGTKMQARIVSGSKGGSIEVRDVDNTPVSALDSNGIDHGRFMLLRNDAGVKPTAVLETTGSQMRTAQLALFASSSNGGMYNRSVVLGPKSDQDWSSGSVNIIGVAQNSVAQLTADFGDLGALTLSKAANAGVELKAQTDGGSLELKNDSAELYSQLKVLKAGSKYYGQLAMSGLSGSTKRDVSRLGSFRDGGTENSEGGMLELMRHNGDNHPTVRLVSTVGGGSLELKSDGDTRNVELDGSNGSISGSGAFSAGGSLAVALGATIQGDTTLNSALTLGVVDVVVNTTTTDPDKLYFRDYDDGEVHSDDISDFLGAIAGSGMTYNGTTGKLDSQVVSTPVEMIDRNETLVEGFCYATGSCTASRTWTLPASPAVGDKVVVKAYRNIGSDEYGPFPLKVVRGHGSQQIDDGLSEILLESDDAALTFVAGTAGNAAKWFIV